jgi:UDP-N-acetyl-D-glucosamine dehydrogenase
VDPYYLSWKAREYDFYTKFIELAAETNSSMPYYTVNKMIEALNRQGKPLLGARVLVVGAAFKRDIDDARNSPAVELMRILHGRGAEVSYHDPYVPEVRLEGEEGRAHAPLPALRSVPLDDTCLRGQDCVCLAVAHRTLDLPRLIKESRLLVDATGATRRLPGGGAVVRL